MRHFQQRFISVFLASLCTLGGAATSSAQTPVRQADWSSSRSDSVWSRADLFSAAAAIDRHEYALDSDGGLVGKLVAPFSAGPEIGAGVRVFFVRQGRVAQQAVTDRAGEFRVVGLTPGYYSVVTAGAGGFSAMGLRVVSPAASSEASSTVPAADGRLVGRTKPVPFQFVVSTIHPIDVRPLFYIAQRFVPGAGGISTPYRAAAPAAGYSSPAPSARSTVTALPAAISTSVTDALLEAYRTYRFPLNASGSFRGQVRSLDLDGGPRPADVRLFFLRDGRVQRQLVVDAAGRFDSGPIEPGYYSLVAAGPGGLAAAGVRLLPAARTRAVDPSSAAPLRTVALRQEDGPATLNLAPISLQDVTQTQQIAQQENAGGVGDQASPTRTPTPGGGGPSGGGGLGGGGLLAAGAAALTGGLGAALHGGGGGGGGTSITTTVSNSPTTTASTDTTGTGNSGGSLTNQSGAGVTLNNGSSGSLGSSSSGSGSVIINNTNTTGTGGTILGPGTLTGSGS